MSAEVKILVTTQTAQAAADLQKFVTQSGGQFSQIGKAATEAGEHVAGMSYYFRSGIDAIRAAAAGGGSRAVFYSLDEGIRGLISSGMKLKTLLPILAEITGAVVVGYSAWDLWRNKVDMARDRVNELNKAIQALPDLMQKAAAAARVGILSPDEFKQFASVASGATPMYRPSGDMTAMEDAGIHMFKPSSWFSETPEKFQAWLDALSSGRAQLTPNSTYRPKGGRTAGVTQLEQAGPDEVAAYQKGQLFTKGITDASGNLSPLITSLNDLQDTINRSNEQALSGDRADRFDKQREAAGIDHQKQLLQLQETEVIIKGVWNDQQKLPSAYAKIAQLTGQKVNMQLPMDQMQKVIGDYFKSAPAAIEGGYQSNLANIQTQQDLYKQQQQDKIQAEQNRVAEQNQKEFEAANKSVEDQITDYAAAAGKERVDFYRQETTEKIYLALSFLMMGKITTQQYQDAVAAATKEIVEGQKAANEEYQKTLQFKLEIARADADYQLKAIQTNPFLTNQQKAQQSIPLIQSKMAANDQDIAEQKQIAGTTSGDAQRTALEKINELKMEQLDLDNQLSAAENSNNFAYQFSETITELQSKWTTFAKEGANAFKTAWDGAESGISGGLTHLFEYGAQKGQWFREIWNGVVGSMISSSTQMAVNWVMNHVIMETATRGLHLLEQMLIGQTLAIHMGAQAAATGATATAATTQIGAHAATAGAGAASSQASIPYVGPILAIAAMAAIVATVMALAHGFAEGGYTGAGGKYDVAGIVHRGEFVVPADATSRIGVSNLEAMTFGGHAAPATSGPAAGGMSSTHIALYSDKNKMLDDLQKSDAYEKHIVDIMGKNIFKFQ